jgi:hypothetical protein
MIGFDPSPFIKLDYAMTACNSAAPSGDCGYKLNVESTKVGNAGALGKLTIWCVNERLVVFKKLFFINKILILKKVAKMVAIFCQKLRNFRALSR